ncbi:MAG: hypothetical protein U1G07_06190 [Verrucomicrobiota bacterium]
MNSRPTLWTNIATLGPIGFWIIPLVTIATIGTAFKVFMGEYAAQSVKTVSPDNHSNWECAG